MGIRLRLKKTGLKEIEVNGQGKKEIEVDRQEIESNIGRYTKNRVG